MAKNGVIVKSVAGKTIWADTGISSWVNEASYKEILQDLKRRFREYWTVEMDNYFIPEGFLKASSPVAVKMEV